MDKEIRVREIDPMRDGVPEGTQIGSTLRYLGTDKHSRKLMEGKFFSNVGPKNFGKNQLPKDDWDCGNKDCSGPHRSYLTKCSTCGMRRPF